MKWLKRFSLKIWSKIKRLFGGKKMRIEKTINKWFEQTFEKFQKEVHPPTENDLFLAGVLFASRKYVRAILSLLIQKHLLPAKALLRCLCELYMKIFWCLNVKGDKEEIKQAIHKNFQSWDYSRLVKDKKLLTDMDKYATGDFKRDVQLSLKKALRGVEEYKSRGIEIMNSVASLCAELSCDRDKEVMKRIYPEIYRNYSRAVHLDRNTFSRLVQQKGGHIMCYDDWDDDINNLYQYCLCIGCDINMLIRKYYGWATEELRQECLNLTSKYK